MVVEKEVEVMVAVREVGVREAGARAAAKAVERAEVMAAGAMAAAQAVEPAEEAMAAAAMAEATAVARVAVARAAAVMAVAKAVAEMAAARAVARAVELAAGEAKEACDVRVTPQTEGSPKKYLRQVCGIGSTFLSLRTFHWQSFLELLRRRKDHLLQFQTRAGRQGGRFRRIGR